MNRLLSLLLFCLLASGLYAQAPSGFKFQAVARDASNAALSSQNVAVRISLVRGGASGTVEYSERHEVSTTDLGVFDLRIGNGVTLNGDFETIEWGEDAYYIKVDLDANGGTSYVNMGASQLLSVPYALYAKSSGSGGVSDPTDELQNLIYDPATNTLTLTNGNSVTLAGGGGVPQTISFDPLTNELTISGGNAVTLPTGLQGEQGPQGPMGLTGAPGPQGNAGPQGETGPAGATGPQGVPGVAGPQGATGPTGPQGSVGPVGAQGPQGEQGETGPIGPQGAAGTGISLLGAVPTVADLPASGNQGDLFIVSATGDGYAWDGAMWNNVGQIQGPAGPAGSQGLQGETGPAGAQGPQGEMGPQGIAGPQGPQGEQGVQGDTGPQGVAGTGVSLLGTVATVADLPASGNAGDLFIVSTSGDGYAWDGAMWNNVGPIQGPAGPAGSTGAQGTTGATGAQGPQGDQGPVGPQGIQGPVGATGAVGPQGDTGPTGATGPQGDQGVQGETGPAGAQGPQGDQGPVGPQGIEGPVGATGAVGPQGDTGPTGATGPQGDQGIQGDTGPAGAQGPQGDQGPAGPAGTYTPGSGISIAGGTISATDNSPTNEIQTLSLSGGSLQLSDGGGAVDVSALGSSIWEEDVLGAYYSTGNVGIGDENPLEALVVKNEDRSQIAIDGTDSDGKASLAFRQFQGIDSYRGFSFEADNNDDVYYKFGLYDYNYLIGTPDNRNRTPIYEVNRKGAGVNTYFENRFHGNLVTDAYFKMKSFNNANGISLDLEVDSSSVTGISRNFNLSTAPAGNDSTVFQLAANDYLPSEPFTIVNPVNAFTSTYHGPSGKIKNRFFGQTRIDDLLLGPRLTLNDERSSLGPVISMVTDDPDAIHSTILFSDRDVDGDLYFSLDEEYIGDGGGGAFYQSMYRATALNQISSFPGAAHWMYGKVQTDRMTIGHAFNKLTFNGSMLEILAPSGENISGLHIDADNTNFSALEVHNGDGPSIDALGGIDVLENSGLSRPHLRLTEEGSDYSRLEFNNTDNSAYWHIAGLGEDGPSGGINSRMNFYFRNDQGAANRFTIMGNGHVGVKNSDPDEELVVGNNFGRGAAVPAISVGDNSGGLLYIGAANNGPQVAIGTGNTFGYTRMRIQESGGSSGSGDLAIIADNVAIGPSSSPSNATLEVEHDGFGLFLQHVNNTDNHWELYSSSIVSSPDLILYTDNGTRGRFDEVSGNYTATSDARLKTNISTFTGALAGVMQLQAKRYNYKQNLTKIYHGFLAQELQTIFPEVVTEVEGRAGEESTLMVDYSQLTVVAITAVQEQQETISAQDKKIKELEARLARIEALLDK